jgi:hypothetical protein
MHVFYGEEICHPERSEGPRGLQAKHRTLRFTLCVRDNSNPL